MIDPRCFSDCDGRYVGADKKIYQTENFTYRTVFSGWDVFRSQFPLQTLINPRLVNDEINSLIQIAQLSGKEYFPRWEVVNAYSGCMLGNPAISVLADAMRRGFGGMMYRKPLSMLRIHRSSLVMENWDILSAVFPIHWSMLIRIGA